MNSRKTHLKPPKEPSTALIQAIKKILRPLVRLLIRFQVSYPYFIQLIKSTYVEVAENDFKTGEKAVSDSRISLLTGVHRKDIRRFRNEGNIDRYITKPTSQQALLISTWQNDPRFQDEHGNPAALEIHSKSGACFDQLVKSVNKQDLRTTLILKECIDQGVVLIDENNAACLAAQAFIPNEDLDQKILIFGNNMSAHLCSGVHNLSSNESPLFERSVHYNNLSKRDVAALVEFMNQHGMDLLKEIDRISYGYQKATTTEDDSENQISAGIYFYTEEQNEQ